MIKINKMKELSRSISFLLINNSKIYILIWKVVQISKINLLGALQVKLFDPETTNLDYPQIKISMNLIIFNPILCTKVHNTNR